MPNIEISVPHNLSQDEALNRIKKFVAGARVQYSSKAKDVQETWDGYVGNFSGSAGGASLSGSIAVNPSDAVIDLKLPFAAMFVKSQIESTIREQLSRILA